MMKPTDREGLEQWLRHCHSRKPGISVAGMLMLLEPSSQTSPENTGERIDNIFKLISGDNHSEIRTPKR